MTASILLPAFVLISLFHHDFDQALKSRRINEKSGLKALISGTVFLTQIISHRQKNADAKVALLISRWQKWKLRRQFSKNCIFPNIQLKGVANKLLQFKNLFDHTNRF